MPKKIPQKAKKQIKQLIRDSFETVKKTPGEMAGSVLEQVGAGAGGSDPGKKKKGAKSAMSMGEEARLEQMKKKDEAMTQRRIRELEAEIERWRRLREEQLRRRREEAEKPQVAEEKQPFQEPSSGRPKRGSVLLGRKKGKAEKAGMKRSG